MEQSKIELNVLVTRPKIQAESLCQLIEQQGLNAIRLPTLEIVALDNPAIQKQLTTLNQYHWIIFISANAVNFVLSANNGKIDVFKNSFIAAVGKATERALKTAGLVVNLIPETQFNTEGLLDAPEMSNISDMRCLIIRGKGGREILANSLRERGAHVDYLEVYRREKPEKIDTMALHLLQKRKIHAITMSSGDALKNLMSMIDVELHANLYLVPIIVISNRLKDIAKKMGFKHIAVTKSPENSAITETVLLSLSSPIN